jgi:dipeptidase E
MDIKEEILKILPRPANQINVAYITTASKTEPDKTYVEKDRKLLEEAGFNIEEIDIEGQSQKALYKLLQNINLIYVQGGNTFHLLKAIRESGFDEVILDSIAQGKIYIGVSAGSIICGPTIETSGWKGTWPDKNKVGLKDITALNIVPFNLFVHFAPKWRSSIKHEAGKSNYPVRILTDKQGFLVQNKKITLVGTGEEIKF